MTDPIKTNDNEATPAVLPPVMESTAQAIHDALFHQYGEGCGFVICILPTADCTMIEAAGSAGELERPPRVAVCRAGMSDELGAQLMRNVLEAYSRKVTAEDPIGEPQGNG